MFDFPSYYIKLNALQRVTPYHIGVLRMVILVTATCIVTKFDGRF